jgi:hypothetical protein
MNPNLRNVHENMLKLGVCALAHANWHAHYNHVNDRAMSLSVLQAAHAAEILIKARIAEEHPLLIFDELPKGSASSDGLLSFDDLFEKARTVQYADLPARLWATTGIQVPNFELYRKFGRLRNAIQHFASPVNEHHNEVSHFIYGVIDPFIHKCWGVYAVDYNEDDPSHEYLMASLIHREVEFLVSPEAAEAWPSALGVSDRRKVSKRYLREMEKRVASATRASAKKKEGKAKT